MALDPVCKMTVEESGSTSAEHNGTTYYFCCNACKDTFLKNPAKYLESGSASGHGHGHHGCH